MIDLTLSLPVTLNRKFMAAGRRIVNSPDSRKREAQLVGEIYDQLGGRPEPLEGPVACSYTITPRSKRIPDIDAYEKQLLDVLEKAGVVTNDKNVVMVSKERLPPRHPGGIHLTLWEIPDDTP
jgi:Holliday junction resolvase RusA-like endonuclease